MKTKEIDNTFSYFYEDRKYKKNEGLLIGHLNETVKRLHLQPSADQYSRYDAFSPTELMCVLEIKVRTKYQSAIGYDSHLLEKAKYDAIKKIVEEKPDYRFIYATVEVFDDKAVAYLYEPLKLDLEWQTVECNKQTYLSNTGKIYKEITYIPKEDAVCILTINK